MRPVLMTTRKVYKIVKTVRFGFHRAINAVYHRFKIISGEIQWAFTGHGRCECRYGIDCSMDWETV